MQGVMLVLKVKLYKFIGFSWSPLFFFFLKLSKGHLELGPLDGMFLNSYFLQGVCVPPVVQWLITSVISDFSANIVSNLGILPIFVEVEGKNMDLSGKLFLVRFGKEKCLEMWPPEMVYMAFPCFFTAW